MSKLRKKFKEKEWQDCCGKLCVDCKIAKAYKKHFGKKDAEKKIKKDRNKII